MDTSESEYGLTLTLHSNANKDVYKDNNPSAFTNLLKIPVKLNQNDNYEVCLANFHSPKTLGLLLKRSDYRKNDVRFNIGMFFYDENKSGWRLLDNSKIDLWSYSLNKDISGLNFDSNVTRLDFFKRFRDSFNLSTYVHTKRRQCLSVLNMFMRHKYTEGHPQESLLVDCEKCKLLTNHDVTNPPSSNTVRDSVSVGDGQPYIDCFEDLDLSKKDHIWFKHLEGLPLAEKYYIFDQLFAILGIDKYAYLRDIIYKNIPHTNKSAVSRILTRIRDKTNNKYDDFQKIFNHEIYSRMWYNKKNPPQLALYATFGDKMANYLSVDSDEKIVILTCGSENKLNMFDYNPILTPQFFNPKIGSLFIYSDLVSKSVRVADQITNLLSIITVNTSIYNKPNPEIIYRPVTHNFIQSVSVRISDENGDEISFGPDSYVALEIIIRKRQ